MSQHPLPQSDAIDKIAMLADATDDEVHAFDLIVASILSRNGTCLLADALQYGEAYFAERRHRFGVRGKTSV